MRRAALEAEIFVQMCKEVFVDFVRGPDSGIPPGDEIILLLDSGGGNRFKFHITLELFLFFKRNKIRLWYYQSWHTLAVCQ